MGGIVDGECASDQGRGGIELVMPKFGVSEQKEKELFARMEKLEIRESDIRERFIRGSGSGGQKINKSSNCVHLLHEPTGTEVKCQKERSQALNRFFARRLLCDKIEEQLEGEKSKAQAEREKIKRQKRRRSRRAKAKMLDEKSKRGDLKESRQKIKLK